MASMTMTTDKPVTQAKSRSVRWLYIALGCLCVTLGVIGIFLPLLPTTPFLLLATWLFARSSSRFHQRLLNHPKLGPVIKAWQEGAGIERHIRTKVLCLLWLSMLVSIIIISLWWVSVLLISIASCVTFYLLKQPVID